MSDTITSVLAILLIFVGLPLLVLKVRDRAESARETGGDPIYLRSGRSEADKVYVTYHDGGDTEILAESVSEMLEVLRERSRT